MQASRFAAALAVLALGGCHLVGEVDGVTFVDDVRCLTAADCASAECQIPTCQDGRCGVVNVMGGEDCSAGVCNGQGLCRECQVDADCPSGKCQEDLCVAETCASGDKDGDETGVDCGGSCAPCMSGTGCMGAGDCAGGICVEGVCEPCTTTTACPAGDYCDTAAGECMPKKPLGASCTAEEQCIDAYECDNDDWVCDSDDGD